MVGILPNMRLGILGLMATVAMGFELILENLSCDLGVSSIPKPMWGSHKIEI